MDKHEHNSILSFAMTESLTGGHDRRRGPSGIRGRFGRAGTALAACLTLVGAAPASAGEPDPFPPRNPGVGTPGLSTMHGDTASSDATPFAGPGTGPVDSRRIGQGAACPTVLHGKDGLTQILCTRIIDRAPVVRVLDAEGKTLTEKVLDKGSLLGGVYAYLDERDRMVVVDGNGDLLRIDHDQGGKDGSWRLFTAQRTPLDKEISAHCGEPGCDAVTSLMPDYSGKVWFATGGGVTGFVEGDRVRTLGLPAGERVDNSISTAPGGTAVATSHALYLLEVGHDGAPRVAWRRPYDRGPARKPGQLSWGTGASPTFFGPRTGTEYVTITDNAAEQENLLVFDTRNARPVCSVPVLPKGASGTEDSPVALNNSVFVGSTYGYPYPALPEGAGPSEPSSAPFTGGMSKVDVRADGSGCDLKWTNDVRSAAVPRLSAADGKLYTMTRESPGEDGRTTPFDRFHYTAIDPATGHVLNRHPVGTGFFADTLEMVGVITPDGVLYQGTTSGLVRVEPRPAAEGAAPGSTALPRE